MPMTKQEFAKRWDSDDEGGGITFDDIAECVVAWGVCPHPRSRPVDEVAKLVVAASGANDPYP